MIRSLAILCFFTLLLSNFSWGQNSVPDAELQRRALEEAKVREEVLKKYRVGDDAEAVNEVNESETQVESQDKTKVETQVETTATNPASDIDKKLEEDKSGFLSGLLPDMNAPMSDLMKGAMKEFLKENPLSKLPPEEVKSMIMVQVTGKPMEQVFKKNPKLLDFVVAWLRDKKALPSLMGILNKQKELKQYGIAFFVVFILSFILNLMSKGTLISRIFKKILITIGALSLNFGIFYWFFRAELSPTVDIIFRYI